MTDTCCNKARIGAPEQKSVRLSGPLYGAGIEEVQDVSWRRQCGCAKTSEKLKDILSSFPAPPPPSPSPMFAVMETAFEKRCGAYPNPRIDKTLMQSMEKFDCCSDKKSVGSKSWQVIAELVQLVQLSVTATALALYYLIYCYMQLVYYTLRSALYFHNADGPMKITIGVVTMTSLIIGFNLMLRMERILNIMY